MPSNEIQGKVRPVIEEIKRTHFVEGYQATDEEAMGLLISKYFEWDGLAILKSTYSALEDANFHTENETIQELIEKVEALLWTW